MAKIFLFTDLDDTWIQTARKLPPSAQYQVAAYDRQGRPLSFITQAQQILLNLFERAQATIIPVTGRSTAALQRVAYHFSSYAIVSHGALILDEQQRPLVAWLDHIQSELDEGRQQLQRAQAHIAGLIAQKQLDLRQKMIVDQNQICYLSVKGPASDLDQIMGLNLPLRIHRNDRNLALLPSFADKARAMRFLMPFLDIQADDLLIAAGDSLSDLPFMRLAQFSLIPNRSQIVEEKLC